MHFSKMLVSMPDFQDFLDSILANSRIGISIDLETWNRRGAGFHTAALVPFDFDTGKVFTEAAMVVKVSLASLLKYPDMLDPSTIRWWMTEPSQEARDELFSVYKRNENGKCTYANQGVSYEEACSAIVQYMTTIRNRGARIQPLGNGAIFDVGKLEASLIQTGMVDGGSETPFPYNFWDIRDLREIINGGLLASGVNVKKTVLIEGTAHNALADAIVQARQAIAAEDLMLRARDALKVIEMAKKSEDGAMLLAKELVAAFGIEVEFSKAMGVNNG